MTDLRTRIALVRMDLDHAVDKRLLDLARVLPGRLRKWVVVDSTIIARKLFPHPSGNYDGPDGLGYNEIMAGAERDTWAKLSDRERFRTSQYPHQDGGFTIIGPECFADPEAVTISWKGENYYTAERAAELFGTGVPKLNLEEGS